MTAIRITFTAVLTVLCTLLALKLYEHFQHKNVVLNAEQKLQQELCDMEPSERVKHCEEFLSEIAESTVGCFALDSSPYVDKENLISTFIDWSEKRSSDTTISHLYCSN